MTAEAGFRVTVKHQSGALLTIGGDTYDEFDTNLGHVLGDEKHEFLAAYADTLRGMLIAGRPQTVEQAAAIVKAQIPARVVDPPQQFAQSEPQLPGSGYSCQHGLRTKRQGNYKSGPKAGQPYTAYFCPTPQGTPDQCKPIFQ